MTWRLGFLAFFFASLCGALVFQLSGLQLNKGSVYVTEAQVRSRTANSSARGIVYFTDKNGNDIPVALNKDYSVIYAVPKEIAENEKKSGLSAAAIAEMLAPIISVAPDDLRRRLSKKSDEYELLVPKVDGDLISRVSELGIKGIYIKKQPFRFYPFLSLGAHIVGFVSPPHENEETNSLFIGRYGMEQMADEELRDIFARRDTPRESGRDVRLTIDRTVQAEGEELLSRIVRDYGATGGTFIVEEPKTGKILGMGNIPTFDPNDFSESNVKNFLNPAVQAVYEPGSIFKVITMAAGIDAGKITPETTYVDRGSLTLNGRTVSNWDLGQHGPYGRATMTNVIEHSINTGAIFAEQKTGHAIFTDYLKKFGFDEKTGIGLPGEVRGSLRNLTKGKEIDYATASYGQGVSVTPLTLINAVSAIANGGLLMKPLIRQDEEPRVIRRVIEEETARQVTKMMASAVVANTVANLPNYTIAGKTGTAFIPDFGGRGYTDQVINTYIGFAPACADLTAEATCDPRFVVLIKLDRPEGAPLAGQTVVPIFREFTQFLLNYYKIAPDKS